MIISLADLPHIFLLSTHTHTQYAEASATTVYSHVTKWKWTENNSQFLYYLTGSILQDLRTVHFWIAQRSAVQNVERIYTGYVANPSNNEEWIIFDYRLLSYGTQGNLFWWMLLYGQTFSTKTLWTNFVLFWKLSSK